MFAETFICNSRRTGNNPAILQWGKKLVHPCHGILLGNKRGQAIDTYDVSMGLKCICRVFKNPISKGDILEPRVVTPACHPETGGPGFEVNPRQKHKTLS
jgi:hypothetical protein